MEALNDLERKRIELSRALHFLATDLAEIKQRTQMHRRMLRLPEGIIPKALALEDAFTEFQKQMRLAIKQGILADANDELEAKPRADGVVNGPWSPSTAVATTRSSRSSSVRTASRKKSGSRRKATGA